MTEEISFIGKKICQYRIMAGMSRKVLAEYVGVSHQQVHKYENGLDRISACRLKKVAECVGREIADFYKIDGVPDLPKGSRLMLELNRCCAKMSEKKQRALLDVARVLAA